jgi:PAS domain-containing protein
MNTPKTRISEIYEAFTSVSTMGVFWFSSSKELLKLNASIIGLLGFENEAQALQDFDYNISDLVQNWTILSSALKLNEQSNSILNLELVLKQKNGNPMSVPTNIEKLQSDNRTIYIVYVGNPILLDDNQPITDSFSVQLGLDVPIKKTTLKQKELIDNIPYYAWLKDDSGVYISVNAPFANLFNLKCSCKKNREETIF